jgi:hypothetical protein
VPARGARARAARGETCYDPRVPPSTASVLFGALAAAYTVAVTAGLRGFESTDDGAPRTPRDWARLLFVVSLFLVNPALFFAAGYLAAPAAPGMTPLLVGAGAAMIDLFIGSLAWSALDVPRPARSSPNAEVFGAMAWLLLGAIAASVGAWFRR